MPSKQFSSSGESSQEDQVQIVPKSPVPKQRISKPSRAERIKSRLSSSAQNNAVNKTHSKERLNDCINLQQQQPPRQQQALSKPSSSLSSSSSSGSSGFSSSRGLHSLEQQMKDHDTSQEAGQLYKQLPPRTVSSDNFRLCQCNECRASGQQIFSRRPMMLISATQSAADLRSDAAILNQAASLPRGTSTQPRKAVSFRSSVEAIGSPNYRQLNDIDWLCSKTRREADDSCDSLHVTKDFSLLTTTDEDYLRPLNCSTPNRDFRAAGDASQQLVRVEVHNVDPVSNKGPTSEYACFCSPNLDCIHNRLHDETVKRKQLQDDCIDCKNLSTYVNLSSGSLRPSVAPQDMKTQSSFGLDSTASTLPKQVMHEPPQRGEYPDPSDYLSVARHIQKTIEDCELCKQQQQRQVQSANSSNLGAKSDRSADQQSSLHCSCSIQQQQFDLSANSKSSSYHTANSLLQNSLYSDGFRQVMQPDLLTGGLSVLPVSKSSSDGAHGESRFAMTNFNQAGSNNIDSSLSSLFAYRHISDDNQPTTSSNNDMPEFDPDSLEISQMQTRKHNQIHYKSPGGKAAPNGWLKGSHQRTVADYVPLASDVSSGVASLPRNQLSTNGGSNKRQNVARVSSVGQSSLAKRRLLAQQQQTTSKKKLQAQHQSNQKQASEEKQVPSKSSNGVKGIYKSVKSHLFDRSKSSSASAASDSKNQSILNRNLSQSSASLPRNMNSSLSAPTNPSSLASNRKPLKLQKVCMSILIFKTCYL